MRSTRASAISAIISTLRTRALTSDGEPVARNVRFRSIPAARSAGTRPKKSAVIELAASANNRTAPSIRTDSSRGRLAGLSQFRTRVPAQAVSSPMMPPATERTALSVASWRRTRTRVAPSAPRRAISRSRLVARASSRCATLAQAISSRKPTATKSTTSARRACLTTSCCSGMTRTRISPDWCSGCSARSCRAIPSMSAWACSNVTCGLSRPNTVKNVRLRGSCVE